MAEKYLRFLYTDPAQEIIAQHYHRPINEKIAARFNDTLKPIRLFPVTALARDWNDAQQRFFADGGVFDRMQNPK